MRIFAFIFCMLLSAQAFAQAPWQPSQKYSTSYTKYAISDSTIVVFPVPEMASYYKVFDFLTKRLYVVFEGGEEVIVHGFSDVSKAELAHVMKQACVQVSANSDFKRFCVKK